MLACSGGVDSMVLAHLCMVHELNFELAHVNYGLRGEDSQSDENLVKDFANKHQIQFHLRRIDIPSLKKDSNSSTQMMARDLRYDWFKELLRDQRIEALLTAHHQQDAIESFFINLLRGTGIKGLRGIVNHDQTYRPLINCWKDDLYNYAKENSIPFREDLTNRSSNYERNWLRNDLFPFIRRRASDFDNIMAKNIAHLHEDHEILDRAIKDDISQAKLTIGDQNIEYSKLNQLKFLKRSLHYMLKDFGFHREQMSNIITAVNTSSTGALFYSKDYSLLVDRSTLIISLKEQHENHQTILIEKHLEEIDSPLSLKFQFINKWTYEGDESSLLFDADHIQFPIRLRKWANGDRMSPFGMKGTKKVSDILIDEKINRLDKEKTYVLENEQGILSVVGVKRSNIAVLSSSTQRAYKVTVADD